MKSFVIIGLGRFGTHIAELLCAEKKDVMVIDSCEQRTQAFSDYAVKAVASDAQNISVLQKLGVQNADCVIVSVASDLAASVLITMNLKTIGCKHIIAKAKDNTHAEILQKLGADEVVIPEYKVAEKLVTSLTSNNILEYIELSGQYGIIEKEAPSSWVGKTLIDLNVRATYGINIIALKSADGDIKVSPSASDIINKDTILVILGDKASFKKLNKVK